MTKYVDSSSINDWIGAGVSTELSLEVFAYDEAKIKQDYELAVDAMIEDALGKGIPTARAASIKGTILMHFSFGNWGANAKATAVAIGAGTPKKMTMKIGAKSYDLVERLKLKRDARPDEANASRLAALGLPIAYANRRSDLHKESPTYTAILARLKTPGDAEFCFLDGYKLPAKMKLETDYDYPGDIPKIVATSILYALMTANMAKDDEEKFNVTQGVINSVTRLIRKMPIVKPAEVSEYLKTQLYGTIESGDELAATMWSLTGVAPQEVGYSEQEDKEERRLRLLAGSKKRKGKAKVPFHKNP